MRKSEKEEKRENNEGVHKKAVAQRYNDKKVYENNIEFEADMKDRNNIEHENNVT